jgi:phosphoribosylformylglycinamidine cyclo-ligase
MPTKKTISYADAGVSIDRGNELVKRIKNRVRSTDRPGVMGGIGGFGGLFDLTPLGYREPVLVSGTDGVGTKLKLAAEAGRHDGVGIDLVAMCANDLLVQGAEPLFFLDYYVCESLDVDVAEQVIASIARGCEIAGCALIGGETAEHPGAFVPGEYDLAGFCVGVVEKSAIVTGETIAEGDAVIALASSGPHANGFSLIRRLLQKTGTSLQTRFGDGGTFADVLLQPTTIYVRPVRELLSRLPVKGMSHITGGSLLENIPRVLPDTAVAEIDTASWQQPDIFQWLREAGGLDDTEMYRTFNCGVGYVVIVDQALAGETIAHLEAAGIQAWRLGRIRRRREGEAQVVLTEG